MSNLAVVVVVSLFWKETKKRKDEREGEAKRKRKGKRETMD
jgi:hypothetical protein